jgi:hypothetical protein
MIAHVVLFKPKPTLSAGERAVFVDSLQHALNNIALIKRARVGRRITVGRLYDEQTPHDFPFAAILEFGSEADLREYLNHPAHTRLGEQFYTAAESALVFDFELLEGDRASELL